MLRTRYPNELVLTSAHELDNDRVEEVCLGLYDGSGGRFRVLARMKTTERDAVLRAGQTATAVAMSNREEILDPGKRPSAIRRWDGPEGVQLFLDYDVGSMEKGRPRTSRPLRLLLKMKAPLIE